RPGPRRKVSLHCGLAGNRSAYSRRCLHFRLPAAAGSAPRRPDKIAGENFRREIVRRAESEVHEETERALSMITSRGLSSRTNVRDLPKGRGSHKLLSVTLASTVKI